MEVLSEMEGVLISITILAVWFILMFFVFPKMGVKT